MELTPPGLDTPLVALDPRRGKIEGSAEALWVRHHPFLFPSEDELCSKAARAIVRTKMQRVAFPFHCEAAYFRGSNLLIEERLLRADRFADSRSQ
jgi:hypothetical protein